MGKYITTTSIYLYLPGFLSNDTASSTDTKGIAIFSRQIEKAESLVDSAVGKRYDLTAITSTAIPPLMRALSEDIAIYNVIKTTGYLADQRNEYMDDYNSAMEMLKQIGNGELSVYDTSGSEISKISGSSVFKTDKAGYTPVFNVDDAEDWEVDSDEIDDISDARD